MGWIIGGIVGAAIIALLIYMTAWEPNRIKITRLVIHHPAVNDRTVRVLLFSDLHLYAGMSRKREKAFEDVVSTINAEEIPDLVLIAGDIIDRNDGIPLVKEALKPLKWKSGAYAVLGNHDYYQYNFTHILQPIFKSVDRHSANTLQLKRILEEAGIKVLKDSYDTLSINGNPVNVTGLDYITVKKKRWADNHFLYRNDALNILMTHYPENIDIFSEHADLILCGHTHGGQVTLFGIPVISRTNIPRRMVKGYHRVNQAQLYVSRGVGVSRYFPFRFFAQPEVTVITIKGNEYEK